MAEKPICQIKVTVILGIANIVDGYLKILTAMWLTDHNFSPYLSEHS